MSIRAARKSDYKQLMILYNDFVGDKRYEKSGSDSFASILKSPTNSILVAEVSKELVGFVSFSIRRVIRYPKPIAEVDEIYVVPKYRKRGLGKRLMKVMLKKAKQAGCQKIFVESAYKRRNAHKFYASIDYKKDGYYFVKNL